MKASTSKAQDLEAKRGSPGKKGSKYALLHKMSQASPCKDLIAAKQQHTISKMFLAGSSSVLSEQEKAFARRLQEQQHDELMNKTQVRSAQLVIRDHDSVAMCFYSDADKKN
mmetsp:Transcript_34903/g.45953  ORF Transcript_34903/g.45953 Transcript_34903/m.45953 type:complete len:112 (-) Transcript_34903:707-1042(-)